MRVRSEAFANSDTSAEQARLFTERTLREWIERPDKSLIGDVNLVVTELVANVFRHAHTDGLIKLWILKHQGKNIILLEVLDKSAVKVRPRDANIGAEDGRGMALVEALPSRWGVRGSTVDGYEKLVWAAWEAVELDLLPLERVGVPAQRDSLDIERLRVSPGVVAA